MSRALMFVLCILLSASARAQLPPLIQPDLPIDTNEADRILTRTIASVRESYVFPEKAEGIAGALSHHLKTREYAGLRTALALEKRLNEDFRAASHDRHLHVAYSFNPLPPDGPAVAETPEARTARFAEEAAENYGFTRAEVLPGNIGYLKISHFAYSGDGGESAVAAMGFLAHTHALIFNLRDNHGGDAGMVALILSYLFNDGPVHLNDIYWRPDGTTGQYWTSPFVAGQHYSGDVYVLTSAHTFSAGEEFAYDLQTQKRATIVGEITAGGAHPITVHRVDDHFLVLVPSGRAINPVTHSDWECTGVHPDVVTSEDRALPTAELTALNKLHADNNTIAAVKKDLDSIPPR